VARAEAATATAAWAEASGDAGALQIACAAVIQATTLINGSTALGRINEGDLLEPLAALADSVEDVGSSSEVRLLRETFRQFAATHVAPLAGDVHRQNLDVPESLITALAELGVFGLAVPEEYGGSATEEDGLEAMLITSEELSRASLTVGSISTRSEILVRALMHAGTEEQKRRWLPAIATGERLAAVATTEPDYGSDVGRLSCRAVRVDGGWEVTGTKLWCTFAGRAELVMLLLRTSDNGHRGLSLFLAEKPPFHGSRFAFSQPDGGRIEGRAIPTIGYRGLHTFELVFDRFFLSEDSLIGGAAWLDRGFYLQMQGFSSGRLQTAARAVGLMCGAFEEARQYAANRSVFGRPIAELGLPRAELGRMVLRFVSARQLNRHAARLVEAGTGEVEASLAKLYAARMAEHVTRDAMQLHGGMGYAEETAVSRHFLDARVLTIFEGAEEVLALRVIAKSLLAAD
jgi:(2S)-methylsuccinyl-CoA dehydrogenase